MYTIEFNPPLAWVGWVALVVATCIFGYLWYRVYKAKSIRTPAKYWKVPILYFAPVFVTKTYFVRDLEIAYTEEMAKATASRLALAKDAVWKACEEAYGVKLKHAWPVNKVVVKDGMPAGHPYVAWQVPRGGISSFCYRMTCTTGSCVRCTTFSVTGCTG